MTILGATLVDVMIALIILVSGILSWLRGFAEELVTILAWVVGLIVAFQFAGFGAQFVPEIFDEVTLGGRTYGLAEFHAPVAGIVLFLLTFVLVSQLHRPFNRMTKQKDRGVLRRSDRVMGFLFGLLRGGLLVLVLVLIAGTTATLPKAGFWNESALIPHFVEAAEQVIEWMPGDWQDLFHYPGAAEEIAEEIAEDLPEEIPVEEFLPDELPPDELHPEEFFE